MTGDGEPARGQPVVDERLGPVARLVDDDEPRAELGHALVDAALARVARADDDDRRPPTLTPSPTPGRRRSRPAPRAIQTASGVAPRRAVERRAASARPGARRAARRPRAAAPCCPPRSSPSRSAARCRAGRARRTYSPAPEAGDRCSVAVHDDAPVDHGVEGVRGAPCTTTSTPRGSGHELRGRGELLEHEPRRRPCAIGSLSMTATRDASASARSRLSASSPPQRRAREPT